MEKDIRRKSRIRPVLVFSLSLFLIFAMAGVGTAAKVNVIPATQNAILGGTFTIDVNIDSGSSNLQAASIELNFNPTVLTANSITNKNLLGTGTLTEPDNGISPGKVKFGLARTAGNPAVPVNGTFITVQFTVNSSAPAGDYVLDLADVQLKSTPIADIPDVQVTDGQVKVGVPSDGAKVKVVPVTQNAILGGTFTIDVNISSGSSNLQAADITLNFNPNVLTANSITNKNLLGTGTLEVPGSGISPGKVKFGLARTAGNPAAPVNGTFITVQFTVNSSAPTGDHVLDLADVQLKSTPIADIPDVQVTDGQVKVGVSDGAKVKVVPVTKDATPGETFTIDVNISSGSSNLQAADITLNFNPTVLTANSITNKNLLGTGTLEVPGSGISPGKVKFGLARTTGNPAVPVNGTFITVQFTVNSSAPAGDYVLDLADVQLKNTPTADIADVLVTDGQVKIPQQGIPLAPGWNYFSVPYVLENASVAEVLKGVGYATLYEWDSGDDKWTSPLTGIVPLKGYLIKVNSSQTIVNLDPKIEPYVPPTIGINKGWNLIGPTGSASLDAETMLGSIDNSYFNLWGWNATTQRYDTVGVNGKQGIISTGPPVTIMGTDVFTMLVGKGYWLWAKENTTLPAFSP